MESMVERLAKAMAAKEGWRWDDERQMLDCAAAGLQNTSRERDTWRNRARAAIEEMRVPTENMLDSGACYEDPSDAYENNPIYEEGDLSRDVWTAMINAALREKTE